MKKGSITVYLSLTLLVLISLIAAGLYGARQAAGRVVTASALEQSLFSLFGQYDRDLMDDFGLLFLDGGYGGGAFLPGKLLEEVETEAVYVLQPKKGTLLASRHDLLGIRSGEGSSVTGYVLATDDGGRAFRRQVCEITQAKLGPAGIVFLRDRLQEQQEMIAAEKAAFEGYEIPSSLPAARPAEEGEEQEEVSIPSWFFDPLQTLLSMQAAGVLAMTVPNAASVSAAETEPGSLLSNRTKESGMAMPADGWEGSGERMLLMEYLTARFPCYADHAEGAGLRYQIEFAIGGKSSDRENLQVVLMWLLHVREATNFLHILRSPALKAEADALANVISLLLLQPELQPMISLLVSYAWAYGESILDLQELLAGGKVPLIKGEGAWQLSLWELPLLRLRPAATGTRNASGLDYRDYLRLLLFLQSSEQMTTALMDLVEMHVRTEKGRTTFRLDHCVDALRVELPVQIGRNQYRIERSYGYNA